MIVNGNITLPGEYSTITAAVAAAQPGDEILIKSVMHNGYILGYSETRLGGLPGETFPIVVDKALTIRPFNSSPVLVWSSAATPPPGLFAVPTAIAGNSTVVIKELKLIGSENGVKVDGPADAALAVLVQECKFAFNQTAARFSATAGADLDVAVRHCTLVDTVLPWDPNLPAPSPPHYVGQAIGLAFHAIEPDAGTNPATIEAEVLNLRLNGLFRAMAPIDLPHDDFTDPALSTPTVSRAIEVVVEGYHREQGGLSPISFVTLDLNSCQLTGHAASDPDAGWDLGVYASCQFPFGADPFEDYTSGYDITANGTVITGFRRQGVACQADADTRGIFRLQGGSVVERTGIDLTLPVTEGEGVRMYCYEGYLALHSETATVQENASHGVSLQCVKTNDSDHNLVPVGLYVDLAHTGIHQNGGDGIHGTAESGVLGGTVHHVGGGVYYFSDITPSFFTHVHGQGTIDSCSISNNGDHGIWLDVLGRQPYSGVGAANLKILNTIVWNHPAEGIRVDLRDSPWCFVPVAHVTVAGNGDLAANPANIEYDGNFGTPAFFRTEVFGASTADLSTKLYNSIFQRKAATADDWGPGLDGYAAVEPPLGGSTNPAVIAVEGLRAVEIVANFPPGAFVESTNLSVTYPGFLSWSSTDPAQFYFTSPIDLHLNHCPPFFYLEDKGKTSVDHGGSNRPALYFYRDKGADHTDDT